jgi:TolB-like protein/DNA-binding winged helix-turn-helix (wHTH) protein/Tfp pilus assembly protein PilF
MASSLAAMPHCVRFGDDFELDLRAYELRSAGIPLKLRPVAMELLLFLLEHRGELVTREQIVERIWGKGVFLDTDNSINGAVSKIRQLLRDDVGQPRFVQTIPGKGYRFIAPVIEVVASTIPPSPALSVTGVADSQPLQTGEAPAKAGGLSSISFRQRGFAVAAVVLIVVTSLLVWLRPRVLPQPSQEKLMLAVLPFQNLTGDSTQDYFSDGMTEEMITQLGNLDPQHLGVISSTSVMNYKHAAVTLDQIGRELKVQYVLEGSVRRDSDKVRITAQLIQVKDQTYLWTRQYDRELSSFLALQAEIAGEISSQIQIAIGNRFNKPNPLPHASSATYESYDSYLKGRYFWNKRTPEGFTRARASFQRAIDQDQNYAQAYAGLADVYAMMSNYGLVPAREYMPKARWAALRALQIDDSVAEAHSSLAVVAENYDWDWHTAEREYRRAIELNPNYATAHQLYAECLAFQGRFEEALAESERARQLDPLSLIIAADNGAIFYFARQYDKAIERFRSVLDMDPGFTRAHLVIAAYVQKGQFKDALADIQAWRHATGDAPWISAWEAYVYGRAGDLRHAQKALQKVQPLTQKWLVEPAQFMVLCNAGVNDKDQLLAWLEMATREHTNVPTGFKVDPLYDPLRGDPRFQDLLRRVGLAK